MRVALAFILLISIAMAFVQKKKERPKYEDEPGPTGPRDENGPFVNDGNKEENKVMDRVFITVEIVMCLLSFPIGLKPRALCFNQSH